MKERDITQIKEAMDLMNKPREKKTSIKNSVGRVLIVALLLILQVVWLGWMIFMIDLKYPVISTIVSALAVILVIAINENETNTSLKTPIMLIILMMPVVGVISYLLIELNSNTKTMRKRFAGFNKRTIDYRKQDKKVMDEIREKSRGMATQFNYLDRIAGFPVYKDTDLRFYGDPADAMKDIISDLEKAEKFIFLEYHAIEDKESFEGISEMLKKKAAEGVDIRILYDDLGAAVFINKEFILKMKDNGIKCRVFNPMMPVFNLFFNNRDHRKITVIDGKVGHTGGFNLANEYFHITKPYGFWKDSGIRLEGPAVQNLTALFLEMWNTVRKQDVDTDLEPFFDADYSGCKAEGYVSPYGDNPIDDEPVGENVYMNIINTAKSYVWFTTPYLILSDELKRSLQMAAKRGVDVRIVTPGIPDKKMTYQVTKSYYNELALAGVRICEYTPGFIHAKQCVSDDCTAVVGTINLDFRSLYHHFENAVLIYGSPVIYDIKADFNRIFCESTEVTEKYKIRKRGPERIVRSLLRLLAPLL